MSLESKFDIRDSKRAGILDTCLLKICSKHQGNLNINHSLLYTLCGINVRNGYAGQSERRNRISLFNGII